MSYLITHWSGKPVRRSDRGEPWVTREEYERSLAPYPHPDYPHIMIGTGPIMEPLRRQTQLRWLQQQIDGDTE